MSFQSGNCEDVSSGKFLEIGKISNEKFLSVIRRIEKEQMKCRQMEKEHSEQQNIDQ